jgi:hypothetical protein
VLRLQGLLLLSKDLKMTFMLNATVAGSPIYPPFGGSFDQLLITDSVLELTKPKLDPSPETSGSGKENWHSWRAPVCATEKDLCEVTLLSGN